MKRDDESRIDLFVVVRGERRGRRGKAWHMRKHGRKERVGGDVMWLRVENCTIELDAGAVKSEKELIFDAVSNSSLASARHFNIC